MYKKSEVKKHFSFHPNTSMHLDQHVDKYPGHVKPFMDMARESDAPAYVDNSTVNHSALGETVSAAAILAVNPETLFSVSFQLSFGATLGIVYLYPRLVLPLERMPWPVKYAGEVAAVSIAAQVVTSSL